MVDISGPCELVFCMTLPGGWERILVFSVTSSDHVNRVYFRVHNGFIYIHPRVHALVIWFLGGVEFVGFCSVPNVFPKDVPNRTSFLSHIVWPSWFKLPKYITCKGGKPMGRISLREEHRQRKVWQSLLLFWGREAHLGFYVGGSTPCTNQIAPSGEKNI